MHGSISYIDTPRVQTARELLLLVRQKLANKKLWFGGDNGRTSGHQQCTYQALSRTPAIEPAYDAALLALFDTLPKTKRYAGHLSRSITRYNDSHTHRTVMKWIDRAIESLGGKS